MVNENIGIAGGLLHSYFVDGAILNDSCTLFVPDGVSPSEYRLMLINKHPRISSSMVALLALLPIHYNMRI